MANPYIQISDETMFTNNVRTYKKVKVLWSDFSEGPVSQQVVERSANGKLLVSIGKTYRMWRGVFKIDAYPQTGFASKTDIETWCTSNNVLKRKLTMIDNYGSTHNVFVVTPVEFKYGSPVPDGSTSFFLVPFEMQTQEAITI
jgi:hypothetical protein